MKPNLKFLAKVRDGGVRSVFTYSVARGGYYYFKGGEATAKKYADAGFIKMASGASLGRPAIATLTEKGNAALDQPAKATGAA